jgi:hypothetical protein
MNKINNFCLLLLLTGTLACGGKSEDKSNEKKADTSEVKAENKPKEEEKSEEKNASDKDGVLNRSLVGHWEYESGEAAAELDAGRLDFKTETDFEAGGGMFSAEGTYSVKNEQLIFKAKVLTGEDPPGRTFTATYTIVEITEKMPYKLKLKNAKGNIMVYTLAQSYGD